MLEILLAARSEEERQGFAAVESARGRLFHRARVDEAGRIASNAITAPIGWNFDPAGPFVRQVLGAQIRDGAAAWDRGARFAVVFDLPGWQALFSGPIFSASGAHVRRVRSAPVLEIGAFAAA